MKPRDVIGRTIVAVTQSGHAVVGGGCAWNVEEILLDNGTRLVPMAVQDSRMLAPVVELLVDRQPRPESTSRITFSSAPIELPVVVQRLP